jgi:hypothetical protein
MLSSCISIDQIVPRMLSQVQSMNGNGQHHEHSHHAFHQAGHNSESLNRTAFMATVHCLTGCTIGEILGMVIGTAQGWSSWPTVALAVMLAFAFGYAMTLWPLRRGGMVWGMALGLAFASDTLSITTMEIMDNLIMLLIPGAMDAGLGTVLFWGSLGASLILAGVAAFPVNRWLISKGKGHAVVHAHSIGTVKAAS